MSVKTVFVLLLSSLSADALDYPEPFFFWNIAAMVPTNSSGKTNFWTTADWVEIKLLISADKKITKTSVLKSSAYEDFNQAQLNNIMRFARFVSPARVDGEYVESELVVRMDYLNWQGLNKVCAEFEVVESLVKVPEHNPQRNFLITVNDKIKAETFRLREVPLESDLKVFEIDRYFVDSHDYAFVMRQPESFEQLDNNALISQSEFKSALQAYSPVDPMFSITMHEGKIMSSHEVNELLPYDKKSKYRFQRHKMKQPSFDQDSVFTDYNGELALNSYTGEFEFTATVLSSGKVENIKFIKASKHERLNAIVIEAIENKYINPAYTNYQPVKDEIKVRLKLY